MCSEIAFCQGIGFLQEQRDGTDSAMSCWEFPIGLTLQVVAFHCRQLGQPLHGQDQTFFRVGTAYLSASSTAERQAEKTKRFMSLADFELLDSSMW